MKKIGWLMVSGFLGLFLLGCENLWPKLEGEQALATPFNIEVNEGQPMTIVSERPVASGLNHYWLVLVSRHTLDKNPIPVLVYMDRSVYPPIEYFLAGRKLQVNLMNLGRTATGPSMVYLGTIVH